MPKIMHIMARTGLEIVMPIFLSPFSTASAKFVSSLLYASYVGYNRQYSGHSG
jgi:hypothetical protein